MIFWSFFQTTDGEAEKWQTLTRKSSVCVSNTWENSPGSKDLRCFFISCPWSPSLLAFRSLEGEHVAEKNRHLPHRAAWGYREMRKGETSALWVCTNHLISSHKASAPQNSTPICHWFVITPLWVNTGKSFLSNHGKSSAQLDEALLFSVKWHHENFIREASWEAGKGLQNYPHIN